MDQLDAMRSYCRVVEAGSFAAAARLLDTSPSAMTKVVQSLETWTGCRLLSRTTRSMTLTEAGRRFYEHCVAMVAETDRVLEELRASDRGPSGRLVISAPVSMTLGVLAPHFHAFQERYPAVELEVRLNDRPADLVREGVDVALRGRAVLEDSTLVAVPLMHFERVLCASPAYWARKGMPSEPQDLSAHDCLAYLLGTDATRWRFEREGDVQEVEVAGSMRSDNSLLLLDALRVGRGVGVVPRPLAEADLREGRLVSALADWRLEPRQLHAVYATRDFLPQRVRAFVDFMKVRMAI
ncbi:LysR family transcriptional regulator [Piscinibacter sp. HJYY11]|uniref:LysR family transcriptional regulator n=1 Tax=Piscinibacter sp. HJYY11 TaxID=2801333 RepID=UPI00191EFE63|nr:LysR family transcriptional regulator [Piscinibacter sp. HJYY11]MBL0729418.1 LysR family transcriptional regulator [Piscinibacter sp. HJYY11]